MRFNGAESLREQCDDSTINDSILACAGDWNVRQIFTRELRFGDR
jgi:hypothetical protein